MGFRSAVIDIGTQRMQGNGAFTVAFAAGDFGTAQTAANLNLDAFGAYAHGAANALFHGAAERNAAFQLAGDVFGNQCGIHIRLFDLLDVDVNVCIGQLLQVFFQQFDVAALTADDHARFCGVNRNAGLVGGALDIYLGNSGQE